METVIGADARQATIVGIAQENAVVLLEKTHAVTLLKTVDFLQTVLKTLKDIIRVIKMLFLALDSLDNALGNALRSRAVQDWVIMLNAFHQVVFVCYAIIFLPLVLK